MASLEIAYLKDKCSKVVNIANIERREREETMPTACVDMDKGCFTLIIAASSYVNLE